MRQRRTSYTRGAQVQQRRTIFQAAESPPEAEDICGESSFFAAISREFYKVVGQAMRQRRTSYARGGQVTPEAHKFRPDSVGTNKSQQRQESYKCFFKHGRLLKS